MRRRWWLWAPLVLVLLFTLLLLSRSPTAPASPPPTVADVTAARAVYARIRVLRGTTNPQPASATWSELAAVASLGGRAAGIDHVSFTRDGGRGAIAASMPLGMGFWLNARALIEPDDDGGLRISGRAGSIPLPGFVVDGLIRLSQWGLRMRGANIPPLSRMVTGVQVTDEGLAANLLLPGRSGVFSTLSGLRAEGIDAQRTGALYCHLMARQRAAAEPDFAGQVRRAFAESNGSAVDNRSAFIALALLLAGTDVGTLPDGTRPLLKRCGSIYGADSVMLLGRADLPKHWSVSAALAAAFGSQASISVGTWKEISDSGSGGTGFSLVDLAANRSGIFNAERGIDEERAAEQRRWLANVQAEQLLPLNALALAEGMSEVEFTRRYTSTDSEVYNATLRRIDETIATHGLRE